MSAAAAGLVLVVRDERRLVALRLDHPARHPPELAHRPPLSRIFSQYALPSTFQSSDRRHPQHAAGEERVRPAQQPQHLVVEDLLLEAVVVLLARAPAAPRGTCARSTAAAP
jgi:hypothetical protein